MSARGRTTIGLVGDMGVGKTTLAETFVKKQFCEKTTTTVGLESSICSITTQDALFRVILSDRAGSSRHQTPASTDYSTCDAVIVAFDLSNSTSFQSAQRLLKSISRAALARKRPIPVLLVGTKLDLLQGKKVALQDTAKAFASANRLAYLETSAKEGTNVNAAFEKVAELLLVAEEAQAKAQADRLDPLTPKRAEVSKLLRTYMTRVVSPKKQNGRTDFEHGFWFFSASRGRNRQANWTLASILLALLNNRQTFSQGLGQESKALIQKGKCFVFKEPSSSKPGAFCLRTIRSAELNVAILAAKECGLF